MATVMLLVTVSRSLAVPRYLVKLGWIQLDQGIVNLTDSLVFPIMIIALISVTPIVLVPVMKVRRKLAKMGVLDKAIVASAHGKRGLYSRLGLFGTITFLNYYMLFRDPEWWPKFVTSIPHSDPLMAIAMSL